MSIWAFLSLVPGVLHVMLGIYVFFLIPRSLLSRIFAMYSLSLAIWCLTEFGHRLDVGQGTALILIRAGGFGWCFMQSLWVHFVLVFADRKRILQKNATCFILYGPAVLFLILFLFTDLIYLPEPYRMFYGYTSLPGKAVGAYALYYLFLYIFATYLLIGVIRKNILIEKKQARPLLFGSAVFLLLATLSNVILPDPGKSTPEIGTTLSIIWTVSVFYAVLKHKLFIVVPSAEKPSDVPLKYSLLPGRCYYIREVRPDRGYDVFFDQITHRRSGLCITKLAPDKIRKRYRLAKTPVFHLTFDGKPDTISPKDLDGLTAIVSQFVRQTQAPILFVDCIDQIKLVNGLKKTRDLLSDLTTLCSETDAIVLLSISPGLFDREEWADLVGALTGVESP
ncbi:MAG TPA: DUF835 domain-containing protein [bacterium]|nr:DUF835 domain-containing protein [bacterium]